MFSYNKYKDQLDIPGTEILVEENRTNSDAEGKNDIVYVPEPSSDPNDPLNWSKIWKTIHITICFLYAMVNAGGSAWTSTVYEEFTIEFSASYNMLNTASGLQYLFLAIGCWASQISLCLWGKRPTYLISSFLVGVGSVAFAVSKTYKGMMAYSIINGFGIAPMDTVVESTIGDLFFLHEHGRLMALYTLFLSLGNSFGPIIAGYLHPWSWCNYLLIIFSGSLFIAQLLFLEESEFPARTRLLARHDASEIDTKTNVFVSVETAPVETVSRKSFIERMAFQPPDREKSWRVLFEIGVAPFVTLRYPAVFWASVAYGVQICWLTLVGLTQAEFYASEPYFFSTTGIGNLSYAGVVGTVVASIYVSFSDKYHMWRTKKNHGISEPEFRLDLTWIPIIVNCLGICLYGYGPLYSMSWVVGAFGIGMMNFGMLCLIVVMLTYVMECYPQQMARTMVAILFVRNIIASIFSWVFQYWLDGMGIKNLTAFLTVICFAVNGGAIFFVLWGKNFRKYTSRWYNLSL
ncbi:hypothetical protein JA9_002325 [Meyerozyma sp. JA9]|nr:hypothetical protein JA9_002325 [Meyerozyma sp. JA9]